MSCQPMKKCQIFVNNKYRNLGFVNVCVEFHNIIYYRIVHVVCHAVQKQSRTLQKHHEKGQGTTARPRKTDSHGTINKSRKYCHVVKREKGPILNKRNPRNLWGIRLDTTRAWKQSTRSASIMSPF